MTQNKVTLAVAPPNKKKPSMMVKSLAAIDKTISRLLTGQVANTNLQKRAKE